MELTAGPASQLEKVFPLLVTYLSPSCYLRCFQSSKGMVQTVLATATTTHLTISAMNTTSSLCAHNMAVNAHSLHLTLQQGSMQPAAFLRQHITTLQLHGMRLEPANLSQYGHLHMLPRLQQLQLYQCQVETTAPDGLATSPLTPPHTQQQPLLKLHTLDCTCCTPFPSAPFKLLFPLLSPEHLQILVIDKRAVVDMLPSLPGLVELQILDQVYDNDVRMMLSHARVKRVVVNKCMFGKGWDLSQTPCSWDSLAILQGTSLGVLGALPLSGIHTCTVNHRLHVRQIPHTSTGGVLMPPLTSTDAQHTLANINLCSNMVWQAGLSVHGGQTELLRRTAGVQGAAKLHEAAAALQGFELELFSCSMPETQQLLELAVRCLAVDALVLSSACHLTSPEALATLAALPAAVLTVCFKCHNSLMSMQDMAAEIGAGVQMATAGFVAGVVSHMPAHVSHVVLAAKEEMGQNVMWEGLLHMYIRGVCRPLRLTLFDEPSAPWTEAKRESVRRFLGKYTSHVQVEYRYLEL